MNDDGIVVIELPAGSPRSGADLLYDGLLGAGGNARQRRQWRRRVQRLIDAAGTYMEVT